VDETKVELLKFGLAFVLVMVEYWAMQPYHEPIIAKIWQLWMRFCQKVAYAFGRAGLVAEHNYYLAVEAGQ
jgi:hypothetical protein